MTVRRLEQLAAIGLTIVLTCGLIASAVAVFYGLWFGDLWMLAGGCAGAVGWSWVTVFAFGGEE